MNVAGMRSAKSEPKKFRSPLVPKADGTLGYRFERSIPIPPRPSTGMLDAVSASARAMNRPVLPERMLLSFYVLLLCDGTDLAYDATRC